MIASTELTFSFDYKNSVFVKDSKEYNLFEFFTWGQENTSWWSRWDEMSLSSIQHEFDNFESRIVEDSVFAKESIARYIGLYEVRRMLFNAFRPNRISEQEEGICLTDRHIFFSMLKGKIIVTFNCENGPTPFLFAADSKVVAVEILLLIHKNEDAKNLK
jgi:hypothetical protein